MQFAQFCSAAGLARDAGSTELASSVYFIDAATGSSVVRCGMSCAIASEPGRITHPAAATTDNFKNWRLAMLLNGISFIPVIGIALSWATRILVQLISFEGFANGSHFQAKRCRYRRNPARIIATQSEQKQNVTHIEGRMGGDTMVYFCHDHSIRILKSGACPDRLRRNMQLCEWR